MPFRAAYCRQHRDDGTYFPAEHPSDLVPGFRSSARPIVGLPMTPEEREALVARMRPAQAPRGARYRADDPRAEPPKAPQQRPLTDAEKASARRLLGLPDPEPEVAPIADDARLTDVELENVGAELDDW